jgi:DNA-binding beta-propeller fold protein YncE
MMFRARHTAGVGSVTLALLALWAVPCTPAAAQQERRYLYVAVPGSDTDRTRPAILVFDPDKGHKFVRRISPFAAVAQGSSPARPSGIAELVRGIAANVRTRRLYLSTVERVAAIDLLTDRVVWEKAYGGYCCDRLDVSPDGTTIYAPAFGRPQWYVINSANGELIATVDVMGWPRQTIYSRTGMQTYLAAWESNVILVADAKAHKVIREVGPFSNFVCPFTVNGRSTLAFANVEGLVGFEVADLQTGLVLDRVVVEGADPDAWSHYECPSHGIALTPDERELWIADGVDNRLHVFDATTYPPVAVRTVQLRGQPRWVTFSLDGRYAYAASDVIDRESRTVVGRLADEHGIPVHATMLLEVDWSGR